MSRTMALPSLFSLVALLFNSPMLAQGTWTKVPALPKACYSALDTFETDAEKVRTELEAAIEKQEQINRSLHEQVFKTDQATLQQRMMAAVQKNPTKAQEIMQAMASMGSDPQGAAVAAEAQEGEFEAKKVQLKYEFQAETKALGPIDLASAASYAQYNKRYENELCARWFGKEVPELLAAYRAHLEERISKRAEAEMSSTRMYELLGVSAKEFRPLAELRGVLDYVRLAFDLYGLRTRQPLGAGEMTWRQLAVHSADGVVRRTDYKPRTEKKT